MARSKLKKKSMSSKNAGRVLQRMQTYVNDVTNTLSKHKPEQDEALASMFVVVVRIGCGECLALIDKIRYPRRVVRQHNMTAFDEP